MIKNKQQYKGFSLVELMVALMLFSVVMMVSTGTLLIMIDINAKAQALHSATSNLSFVLDSMTREIRMGHGYYCVENDNPVDLSSDRSFHARNGGAAPIQDCANGNEIQFEPTKNTNRIGYRLNNGKIEERHEELSLGWIPITSNDVVIDIFKITVANTDRLTTDSDTRQPTVKLVLAGHVNNGLDTDTDFNIQTQVVQRIIDI